MNESRASDENSREAGGRRFKEGAQARRVEA